MPSSVDRRAMQNEQPLPEVRRVLPFDVFECLGFIDIGRKGAGERNIGVCRQIAQHVCVSAGERAQQDIPMARGLVGKRQRLRHLPDGR